MRILHISDLHLQIGIGGDPEKILNRLVKILEKNVEIKPFDHVVFTGDLKDQDKSATVDEVIDVINRIKTAAKVYEKGRIHIVPGNHDLFRGETGARVDEIRKKYKCSYGLVSADLVFLNERFDDFFWPLCDKFYGDGNPWSERNNNPHTIILDKEKESAFIYLNSCITSVDRDLDNGNLVVGQKHFSDLFNKISDTEKLFILSHHSAHNIERDEKVKLREVISSSTYSKEKVFWLCGDAHTTDEDECKVAKIYQVGRLLDDADSLPDFAIYDINDEDSKVERRIFRFLPHLNGNIGGWKRVYIDPRITK